MIFIVILLLVIWTQTSGEYGGSWMQTSASIGKWTSIASDDTGQYLVAVQQGGGIYTSSSGYNLLF